MFQLANISLDLLMRKRWNGGGAMPMQQSLKLANMTTRSFRSPFLLFHLSSYDFTFAFFAKMKLNKTAKKN